MSVLELGPGHAEPRIILDRDKGIFELSGKSFPEDVREFYNPVLSWIDEYIKVPNALTIFDFRLTFFNTSSHKILLAIFFRLETILQIDKKVIIKWYYPKGDDELLEAGKEFSEQFEIPFEFVVIN